MSVFLSLQPSRSATSGGGYIHGYPGLKGRERSGAVEAPMNGSTAAAIAASRNLVTVVGTVNVVFPAARKLKLQQPRLEHLVVSFEAFIGYPSDDEPKPILVAKELVLINAKVAAAVLTDSNSSPYQPASSNARPQNSSLEHHHHDTGLRCIPFPFTIPLSDVEVKSLPPALALTSEGPLHSILNSGHPPTPASNPKLFETGIFYILKCEARFQGFLENTELSDQVLVPFPSFKESNILSVIKSELGSAYSMPSFSTVSAPSNGVDGAMLLGPASSVPALPAVEKVATATEKYLKVIKRSGRWADAPPEIVGWSFELDSHDENLAVACFGDRKYLRFKVGRDLSQQPGGIPTSPNADLPVGSGNDSLVSPVGVGGSAYMTTLGAGAVVAEPDEYESLGGNQHPCNRHLDQQGKRVGSFSKVSDLPPGTLRPSSVTSQRSTPVQSTSAVVTTPKQKRGDSERLDDVLSGISHENSSAAVTKMVADFKSASLVEKISESARNSPRLVKSGPFGGTGYASISVFLVESWFWGDIQKGGEREILLLDLKESETITFSRGERFEVTLPEGILPTVKATNIQTSHKLLIRFSYINLAFSALPSTCTAEINFRIAAFSRRDLDLLLSNERLLSPDILKILPEGYCGRKLAERKRRESIESLRGVFASASMPNLMPKLAVKGGEGAVAMPSGFGVLNATRPSTAEEGIFVATVGMTGQGSRVNFMPILSEGNVPAASGVPKGTGVVGLGLKGGSGDSPSSWSKLKGVGGFGMFRKK